MKKRSRPAAVLSRRRFLAGAAAGAGLSGLPLEAVLAQAASPSKPQAPWRPIRVRGRIATAKRGIGGVAVSDGLTVAVTDPEGEFELVSNSGRRHVFFSLPSGYAVPRNARGTARLYAPLKAGPSGEASVFFQLQEASLQQEQHLCFLLADPQTQNGEEMAEFLDVTVPEVAAMRQQWPGWEAFGIGCGDLMWDRLELFPDYEEAVHRMEMPFFQVVGNHDLNIDATTHRRASHTFQDYFGPDYYSFNRGAVHYVVLNDVFWHSRGYIGYLDEDQLAWLEQDLRLVEPGRPVVVALHIPLQSSAPARGRDPAGLRTQVQNRDRLYRLLERYPVHVLSGHTHESEHITVGNNLMEHVHGAVCGAWWTGPICSDGTPRGYAIYEIRGEEVRWQYKATGRPLTEQLSVYPRGADPAAPDEIVANVWNWDPAWEVVWYEDGQRRGPMARRQSQDPDSRTLYAGADLPKKHPWIEPSNIDHLFFAPVSPGAEVVTVEAIDRFRRIYTQSLNLDQT